MIQTAITSNRSSFLSPTPATRNLTLRKSLYDLTAPEVLALRKAFAAIQAIRDNRGYQYLASIHGLNQYYCHHGDIFFLIWHRPYLLMFEQALQAVSPGLGLPFWDWTTPQAQNEGIPAILAAKTYRPPGAKKAVPNPLYSAAISFKNPNHWTKTFRQPGPLSGLGVLPGLVQTANRAKTYDRFSPASEQPHNSLHGWVGGSMGQVPYAAFDPIFWVHHCFVEKLFCDWQDRVNASIPTSIAGQVMAPFATKTDDVWNYKRLGYRYAPEAVRLGESPRQALLAKSKPLPTHAATFDLAKVPQDLEQADLHFIKTKVPLESFEVRVFFNEPNPTVATPTRGNPRYAGSLFTFGHGGCTGDPGHCKVPVVPEDATQFAVLRPEHHLTPRRLTLDVTKALRVAKSASSETLLEVHLVLVDPKGKELPETALDFELLTLDAI